MNASDNMMKKGELIKRMSDQLELPTWKVKAVVEQVFDAMSEGILSSESFKVQGLGKFVVKDRPESTKTNPETGETVNVPAKKVVVFQAAKTLKEKLTAQ